MHGVLGYLVPNEGDESQLYAAGAAIAFGIAIIIFYLNHKAFPPKEKAEPRK